MDKGSTMNRFKLTHTMGLEQLKEIAKKYNRLVYGFNTCWWKIGDPIYKDSNDLPCGPRGEVLLETDDPVGFIEAAEKNPDHYGKHKLEAFVAAYHGNVRTVDGKPTSFETWDKYNELIDENLNTKKGE